MKLSKNFSLSEIFGRNAANVQQSQTAGRLCTTVLQPLRDWLNHPIVISSGHRSPEHNKKIGSPTSEHTWQGSAGAVDVSIFDHTERVKAVQWIMDNLFYGVGQVIYYTETTHLHISIADSKQSEFMVCTSKKNHTYKRIKSASDIAQYDKRLA